MVISTTWLFPSELTWLARDTALFGVLAAERNGLFRSRNFLKVNRCCGFSPSACFRSTESLVPAPSLARGND